MSLTEIINADIKKAMLAKEKEKLAALRAIKSALLMEATKGGDGSISEDDEIKILKKQHKQRIEAASIFKEQSRQEQFDEEMFQAKVIEAYLPEQMSEEAIAKVVNDTIAQLGAQGPADMGKVIGAVNKQLAGKADGKTISDIVKKALV